jgi:uncharacterized protein YajQ (UPF0234 family)
MQKDIQVNTNIEEEYDKELNNLKKKLEIKVKGQIENAKDKYKSCVQFECTASLLLTYIEDR